MDRSQAVNEDFQAFALGLNRRTREPAVYVGSTCIECGDEIPEARRQAQPGCRRCVPCQEQHEIDSHWRAL